MTYPDRTLGPARRLATPSAPPRAHVVPSPRFPEIERDSARVLEARRHVPRLDRAARGCRGVGLLRRPAVRQRPAALRPPADRVRQGPVPALPDHARQEGRPRLRLGHPRTARRARGDEAARHHREGRDRGDGHRDLQREGPRIGARVHPRVAGLRHPPGALGRLRERLQDARHDRTWRACSGRSRPSTTRASPTRATACCPTAGATRPRCRTTSCAWTTTSTRCARTSRSRSPSRSSGAKAEALGLTGVRALAWTTTPWTLPTNLALAVGPDIRYAVVPGGPAARPTCTTSRRTDAADDAVEATVAPVPARRRPARRTTRRTSATSRPRTRARRRRADRDRRRARGRHLRPAVRLLRRRRGVGHAERLAHPRRRLRHDQRRHRHRAPGPRLRRGRPAGLRGRRHPGHHVARRRRPLPAAGDRCRGRARGSTRTSRSSACCARTAACSAWRATSTPTRTAGAAATR